MSVLDSNLFEEEVKKLGSLSQNDSIEFTKTIKLTLR